MFSYEFGVLIAFIFFLYGTLNILVRVNSRMEKNLNKVGMRLSWLTGAPEEMTAATENPSFWKRALKFSAISIFGLILVPLSWFSVALFVGGIIYQRNKDAGAPAYIREYRWKLRNVDMSFNTLVSEIFKVAEAQGVISMPSDSIQDKERLFREFREGIVQGMLDRGLLVQLMKIRPEIQDMKLGAQVVADD